MRRLRDHAFSEERHFWHQYLGYNYRMTNLQAAVGLAQTERLAAFVEKRRANALRYSARLKDVPGLTLPAELPWARSVFWMYGIRVGDSFGPTRDELRGRLADAGIETRSFFIPMHLQPIYFREHRGESYPVAEELCRTGLYLPSGPGLSPSDLDFVAAEIERAGRRARGQRGTRRKPSPAGAIFVAGRDPSRRSAARHSAFVPAHALAPPGRDIVRTYAARAAETGPSRPSGGSCTNLSPVRPSGFMATLHAPFIP